MTECRICFEVAGAFGMQVKFKARPKEPYEEIAKSINKEKVAEALRLSDLGYTAADIRVITPEEYDEKYGEDKT